MQPIDTHFICNNYIQNELRKMARGERGRRTRLTGNYQAGNFGYEPNQVWLLLSKIARGATVVFHLFQFPDTSEPQRTCYFAAAAAATAAAQFSIVPSTVQRNVSKRLERSPRGVCSKDHCSARETSVRVILLNLIWPHIGAAVMRLSSSLLNFVSLS